MSISWSWEDPVAEARKHWLPITTLIFGVEGTLHEPHEALRGAWRKAVRRFMMEKLQIPDEDAAERLLDEFLPDAASTPLLPGAHMKALLMAESAGRLPRGAAFYSVDAHFEGFGDYLVKHTDWSSLQTDEQTQAFGEGLKRCSALKLLAFSNAPRAMLFQVLDLLELESFFDDHRFLPHRSGGTQEAWKAPRVFSIEDVLPSVKPEPRAYQRVLRQALSDPLETVVIDSACTNLASAKALGMRTILVSGAPCTYDSVVDVHVATIDQVFGALAELGYEGCCAMPDGERRRLQRATLRLEKSEGTLALEAAEIGEEGREGPSQGVKLEAEGKRQLSARECALSGRWVDEWQQRLTRWFSVLPMQACQESPH